MNHRINSSNNRLSGVELLRIIAILLICVFHSTQTAMRFSDFSSGFGITSIIFNIIKHFGNFGNMLFVICSSWFLLDSKRVKPEKAIGILYDSSLISIIWMVIILIFGFSLSTRDIIHQIFPDIYGNVWFVPAYIILYIAHPILNNGLKNLSYKVHLTYVILAFLLYGVLAYYTGYGWYGANDLFAFIVLYVAISFFKLHMAALCNNRKLNLSVFIISIAVLITVYTLKPVLASKFQVFSTYPFVHSYLSPVKFLAFFSLFNLFRTMNFKSGFVNCVASCSLFVYCFHENILFRSLIRPQIFEYLFKYLGKEYAILIILSIGIMLCVCGYAVSLLYKLTLQKVTKFAAAKSSNLLNFIISKIEKILKKKANG